MTVRIKQEVWASHIPNIEEIQTFNQRIIQDYKNNYNIDLAYKGIEYHYVPSAKLSWGEWFATGFGLMAPKDLKHFSITFENYSLGSNYSNYMGNLKTLNSEYIPCQCSGNFNINEFKYTSHMSYIKDFSIRTQPVMTKVVYQEPATKVVYQQAPPIVYQEPPTQVVYQQQPQVIYHEPAIDNGSDAATAAVVGIGAGVLAAGLMAGTLAAVLDDDDSPSYSSPSYSSSSYSSSSSYRSPSSSYKYSSSDEVALNMAKQESLKTYTLEEQQRALDAHKSRRAREILNEAPDFDLSNEDTAMQHAIYNSMHDNYTYSAPPAYGEVDAYSSYGLPPSYDEVMNSYY